jgi:hypothetical protein
MNYAWYINNPEKREDEEDYWILLNDTKNMILRDCYNNYIRLSTIEGDAANLYLYKGNAPTLSNEIIDDYLIIKIDNSDQDCISNSTFGRKIKCIAAYEGY